MFTGTDDSTKHFLPSPRLGGRLSCLIWGFLNTCLPTTPQLVTHRGTFLCMCLTHVLKTVAVRFSSFRQSLCGCAKVLHVLLVNFIFTVVRSDALTSLSEFHFHLCASTFTPSCVFVTVKVISLPKIRRLRVHECVLSCFGCCEAPRCHLVELKFLSWRSCLSSEWWTWTHLRSLAPVLGNNGTFSQQRATAVRDQNINKARWRARRRREACLVWKPTELIEECGIMKSAYLISEVCFLFRFSSLASPSILLRWFCLSVSVGALDMDGDTQPSALGRLSHTTSLKRGGSLRVPRSNSECHCHTCILSREGPCFRSSLCFELLLSHLHAVHREITNLYHYI